MIRVTPRYVALAFGGILLALLPAWAGGAFWGVWLAFIVLVLVAGGVDLLLAPLPGRLRLELELPEILYIGGHDAARIALQFDRHRRPVQVEALLEMGALVRPQESQRFWIPAGKSASALYPLVPVRRGTLRSQVVWLRWTGPLRFVEFVRSDAREQPVAIVPNTHAVRQAALQFNAQRAFQIGLKSERFVGEGSEFESLREYLPGFDHRAIDWKASARHRTLLCQEFRAERSHQVVLGFDTGRLMGEPLLGIPRLDHAINAGLLLSYCCLKTGDRVAFFAFDERVRLLTEPRGGVHALYQLQQRSAELEYSTAETNFTLGLTELTARLRRRSLVVILTDFVDTVTAQLMLENMGRLGRRHVVVCVALRDPQLDHEAKAAPRTLDQLHRSVVASDLIRERDLVIRKLRRRGVDCLDVSPLHLSTRLLNRYLEIKRRELV